jgi:rhodanese-related sulfurtransferase
MTMSAQRLSLASLAVFVLLTSYACSQDSGPTLTAPDAYAKAQAGTLTLIDIRHPEEWRQTGVAKGALRIDMPSTQGKDGFVQRVAAEMGGKKNAPIALLSTAGNRATNAQQMLRDEGFTQVYNVKEGMNGGNAGPGWIARGLPVQPCPNC